MKDWYLIDNSDSIATPALIYYPDRIQSNIDSMISIAGSTERLRPHIKTYKCKEVIRMQMSAGIRKFKCATIAEAEMAASAEVKDLLLAYQPLGPNITRFIELLHKFPDTRFSTLVDNISTVDEISKAAIKDNKTINVYLDINNGMNRTGIRPDNDAYSLFTHASSLSNIYVCGLHVYDGHIRNESFDERKRICDEEYRDVHHLIDRIKENGLEANEVIAGGSPSFPVHAMYSERNLSPGTALIWDAGYKEILPDLDFLCAGVLLTRVISKHSETVYCLDLGHKAVASEMPHPRVQFPDITEYEMKSHSEEHIVVEQSQKPWEVGDVVYGIPTHICPTTALHEYVLVAKNHEIVDEWPITARKRKISI